MHKLRFFIYSLFYIFFITSTNYSECYPCLYFWKAKNFTNFGDYLSVKLVSRIVNNQISICADYNITKKFLAIGSILAKARDNDIIWGSGINGKKLDKNNYSFSKLDVRAVRGPLTREYLIKNFHIYCPEIYGDPALLFPYLFPEFKKQKNPSFDYLIIPHYSEMKLFSKKKFKNVVYPIEPWDHVIKKILNSKFVISSSLHGIILAEAYRIPARLLRVTNNEPIFKYRDYYLGTNRPNFKFAKSVEEAIEMGGEIPFYCNLKKLYLAFPFDLWANIKPKIKL